MSVYTSVSQSELENFLQNYELGELVSYEGITAGIENTNYFVDTTRGQFVLTLFEMLKTHELPFYLELMAFLNEHAIPSAHPIADKTHNYVHELNGKPATLMQRLVGRCQKRVCLLKWSFYPRTWVMLCSTKRMLVH